MVKIFKSSNGKLYKLGIAKRLSIVDCKITINPLPSDATVTLTASGYTQVGNSIIVKTGVIVQYSVSKTGYETASGTITASGNQTITIILYPQIDLSDYEYNTTSQHNVTLTKYIGLTEDITTPSI